MFFSGAFLIPYTIMLIFVGLPVFFIELSAGQYSGMGPFKAFGSASPLFQGKYNIFLNTISYSLPQYVNESQEPWDDQNMCELIKLWIRIYMMISVNLHSK